MDQSSRSTDTDVSVAQRHAAPATLKLTSWDPTVFVTDMLESRATAHRDFEQTSKSLSVGYSKIMSSLQSYFDVAGFEPSIAHNTQLEEKKRIYQFTTADGKYPPHLAHIKEIPQNQNFSSEDIFGKTAEGRAQLDFVFTIIGKMQGDSNAALMKSICPCPSKVSGFCPSTTFAEIMENHRKTRGNVNKPSKSKPSVGDWDGTGMSWYSDAMFAQQSFTGTNPTTIQRAGEWTEKFLAEAKQQPLAKAMAAFLEGVDKSSLYVQDCSYFRKAFGIEDQKATMSDGGGSRWACAAVTLFHLNGEGTLHPLAIVIDYKGSMQSSVVIFNKRLNADDTDDNERQDWPWRYAKTCSQVSDWIRHELAIHLTNTHLVEEAIIVASQRTLPSSHIIYNILLPHWDKTLSLNAAARGVLVPNVIIPIIGVTEKEALNFIKYTYKNFDFEGNYIPEDLNRRGFPLPELGDLCCRCELHCDSKKAPNEPCTAGCGPDCHQIHDKKFTNYTYARNMKLMWAALRKFVKGYLASDGFTEDSAGDKKLGEDKFIHDWVKEIRHAKRANLPKFPEIKTVQELIDAVTMCIHIASPQHTAVNYLQQYYLSFVVNKPPALCAAPPNSLSDLMKYKEADLIKALPVAPNRDAEWLLASNLPALLSQTVTKELNLVTYAVNVYFIAQLAKNMPLMEAAETFCKDLWVLGNTFAPGEKNRLPKTGVFTQHSNELTEDFPKYDVMDPVVTAVSILI